MFERLKYRAGVLSQLGSGRGRAGRRRPIECKLPRASEKRKPAVRLQRPLFASPIGRVPRFQITRTQRKGPRSFHKNAVERGKGAGSRSKAAHGAAKTRKKTKVTHLEGEKDGNDRKRVNWQEREKKVRSERGKKSRSLL